MTNSIKHISLLIICLTLYSKANSQSGYLGSTININAQINNRIFLIDLISGNYENLEIIDTTQYAQKRQIIKMSALIGVNKVINDNIQLGINYRYTPFKTINRYFEDSTIIQGNQQLQQFTSFNNLNGKFQALSFSFKSYKRGISPIGKFFGLELGFGKAVLDKNQENHYGILSYNSSGYVSNTFFKKTSNMQNYGKRAVMEDLVVKELFINFSMGKTIPITTKLGLNLELSAPLLRYYILSYSNYIGLRIPYVNNGVITVNDRRSYEYSMARGLKKSQGFRLNIGLKYFI